MEVGTLCRALTEAAVQPHEAPTASFVGMQYLNILLIYASFADFTFNYLSASIPVSCGGIGVIWPASCVITSCVEIIAAVLAFDIKSNIKSK